mmetsp:Transcript_19171/g.41819  ORF Transcript_19171/g.41819 Transcript_19171/m.41819 type:complete len:107 (-) Transcript_19171:1556-1876(-)
MDWKESKVQSKSSFRQPIGRCCYCISLHQYPSETTELDVALPRTKTRTNSINTPRGAVRIIIKIQSSPCYPEVLSHSATNSGTMPGPPPKHHLGFRPPPPQCNNTT